MDKQHFDQLVKGVKEMKRHIAGKTVRGAPEFDSSRRQTYPLSNRNKDLGVII